MGLLLAQSGHPDTLSQCQLQIQFPARFERERPDYVGFKTLS
jgi:hypothetical protein